MSFSIKKRIMNGPGGPSPVGDGRSAAKYDVSVQTVTGRYIHMSRVKLVMLSLLAALALTAVASSTALATHEFKVNTTVIPSGSKVEVQGQIVELGQLEGEISTIHVHITCNDAKGNASAKNVLESGGKSQLEAEFTGCTVYEVNNGKPESLPNCKIKKITAEAEGKTVTENGVVEFTGNKSGGTKEFGTVSIEDATSTACAVEGAFETKGSQLCDVPSYGFESDIGELICTGTGSKELKLDGNPAKIYARLGITGTKGQTLGWKE
jgi:hypothetical protein